MRHKTRTQRSRTTACVPVSRTERDALHPELTFGLYGTAPDLASREQATDYRARLDLLIRLHDDLGWSTDDPRQRFTLTGEPDSLRRWLNAVRRAAERAIADEHHALQALLDEPSCEDWPAAVREAKAVIDGDLETIHACDAIVRRLPAEAKPQRPHASRWRRRSAPLAGASAAR